MGGVRSQFKICTEKKLFLTQNIKFYEKKGAKILKDWYLAQLEGDAIKNYIDNL